jgi:hypothetical protein
MKRIVTLLGLLVLAWAVPALAGPVALSDDQMDGITAGDNATSTVTVGGSATNTTGAQSANGDDGGAVVASVIASADGGDGGLNDTSATVNANKNKIASIAIGDQNDFKAVNNVNAALSKVANGVNANAVVRANQTAKADGSAHHVSSEATATSSNKAVSAAKTGDAAAKAASVAIARQGDNTAKGGTGGNSGTATATATGGAGGAVTGATGGAGGIAGNGGNANGGNANGGYADAYASSGRGGDANAKVKDNDVKSESDDAYATAYSGWAKAANLIKSWTGAYSGDNYVNTHATATNTITVNQYNVITQY